MGHKQELDNALLTQFKEVDTGEVNGQKKKEAVETLDVLYKLKMAQEKADQESELKESEMVLKEEMQKFQIEKEKTELEIKKLQAELDEKKLNAEIEEKKQEAKRKKAETIMHGVESTFKWGFSGIGLAVYQKNFKSLVANENTIHVIAQRPFMFLKDLGRLALLGVKP